MGKLQISAEDLHNIKHNHHSKNKQRKHMTHCTGWSEEREFTTQNYLNNMINCSVGCFQSCTNNWIEQAAVISITVLISFII